MASKVAYYGAIVIIAMFVLSMFITFLYSDNRTPTPTPSVLPTPSAQLASFQGIGSGAAVVKGFGDLVLVSCQSSGADVSGVISSNSCVKRAFRSSDDVYSVTLNALNSSGQASECLFEIRASIADSCQSTALRQAFLEFNSTIVFFDENRTQSLNVTPREFSSYANSFGTIGFPGFVLPLSEVNSSIDVMIISAIEGGALTNVLAQQTSLEGYTDTVGGAYVLGTVVLYGDKGRVYWPISWEKRGSVNSAAVRDFLNQSPARLNLSWFDFTNDTLVRITGVAYSAQNQSFLEKQDFVSSVDYKNGEFQLAIKDGFTDKKRVEELAKKIDQVGIAKTVFPDSAIIFTFSPNSNFSQSVEFVKSVVSADARIQVSAVVLLNATKASLATGIIMPKLLQESAYVFYSPGQKTGRDARMLVSAIARNKIPLQIDAVEN